MITDEQIMIILTMARKSIAKGEEPNWKVIRDTLRVKFCDDYTTDMLERVYQIEKDKPEYAPRKPSSEDYIDTNI